MNNFRSSRIRRTTGRVQTPAAVLIPSTPPLAASRIDLIFQRIAHASQLALVLLAVFGYFYTVLPVYQKSLLDEEIAKKTFELRAMERRLLDTNTLLAARSAEFNAMTNRVDELKTVAATARQGLAIAQANVGKLNSTVDSQYAELRPRLISEFQSLVLTACKTTGPKDTIFAECVDNRVLNSPLLTALVKTDRILLKRLVQTTSSAVESTKTGFWSDIARRRAEVESQEKEVLARCEQSKNTDAYKSSYKDSADKDTTYNNAINKINTDYACSFEKSKIDSAKRMITIAAFYSNDTVLMPHLNAIAQQFFDERPNGR